jgi:hypothetical protein
MDKQGNLHGAFGPNNHKKLTYIIA